MKVVDRGLILFLNSDHNGKGQTQKKVGGETNQTDPWLLISNIQL